MGLYAASALSHTSAYYTSHAPDCKERFADILCVRRGGLKEERSPFTGKQGRGSALRPVFAVLCRHPRGQSPPRAGTSGTQALILNIRDGSFMKGA